MTAHSRLKVVHADNRILSVLAWQTLRQYTFSLGSFDSRVLNISVERAGGQNSWKTVILVRAFIQVLLSLRAGISIWNPFLDHPNEIEGSGIRLATHKYWATLRLLPLIFNLVMKAFIAPSNALFVIPGKSATAANDVIGVFTFQCNASSNSRFAISLEADRCPLPVRVALVKTVSASEVSRTAQESSTALFFLLFLTFAP